MNLITPHHEASAISVFLSVVNNDLLDIMSRSEKEKHIIRHHIYVENSEFTITLLLKELLSVNRCINCVKFGVILDKISPNDFKNALRLQLKSGDEFVYSDAFAIYNPIEKEFRGFNEMHTVGWYTNKLKLWDIGAIYYNTNTILSNDTLCKSNCSNSWRKKKEFGDISEDIIRILKSRRMCQNGLFIVTLRVAEDFSGSVEGWLFDLILPSGYQANTLRNPTVIKDDGLKTTVWKWTFYFRIIDKRSVKYGKKRQIVSMNMSYENFDVSVDVNVGVGDGEPK